MVFRVIVRRQAFLDAKRISVDAEGCGYGTYYEDGKGCVDPTVEPFLQGLSVTEVVVLETLCQYNTDCLGGMYCSEVNPNQPGCTYDIQCEAVWPGAKCRMDSSIGTCRCPALNDPNPASGSLPVGCTVGSSASVEPVVGLHGGGACIWPSSGEFIGDVYDCIHTSPHRSKSPVSQYAPTANGVCCPSRALACTQPQVTGPNPTEPRWWYNSVTGTCQQFMWDPHASEAQYHSANNFRTIQHCESYCRDTCSRGSPQYSGEAQVNVERPVTSCASSVSCGNDFQCAAVGSQHLCCPTPGMFPR
ncbi:Kunitz/Bovine pancreatic trypsin inhibitor domain protein [Cooperia oncophora]